MPPEESIERYKRILQAADVLRARRAAGEEPRGGAKRTRAAISCLELTQVKPGSGAPRPCDAGPG